MSAPLVQVENVTFGYTPGALALRGVSLSVGSGELTAIIGNNGSGKSTLMKLILGLIRPTSGVVRIEGEDTRGSRVSTLARSIGFIFQNPNDQLFAQTVEDEIRFGLKNLHITDVEINRRVEETLAHFGLDAVRSMFPRFLSRGDKQKVCIASVVAMRPSVLLLDEPTTGQDHRDARAILDLAQELNRDGMCVLLVTHDLVNVAAYARRVIVLKDGVIVADGPTAEVLANLPLLESCSLVAPQIIRLSLALRDVGVPIALRTSDLADDLQSKLLTRNTGQ